MSEENTKTRERISGLFSTEKSERIGTGTTQRKKVFKTYWYVTENDAGELKGQPLNENQVPAGPKTDIDREEFMANYTPEMEHYMKVVFPALQEVNNTVERAEAQRQKGALYSAEFEYENVLAIDEENVRANFGLGLTYMERGDTDKAKDVLKRIVGLDAPFQEEHKHLFNDFGINLRKNNLNDEALAYYERAVSIGSNDENIHYNIARVYYQKGENQQAAENLQAALKINPDHDEAQQFLNAVKKKIAESASDLNFT
ncbi:MAG: tetratricopeptide repeat protein [Desulfovibrio sp.]